ncbi:collagen, type I, alpha 1a-like [Gorilla gorilla gorilla]|uniref:collagen, type I, alpha 1a-like n=1 Tax=Gorilla gorilla gorilla TaxID=9595 RepID=UPI0030099F03
MAGEDKGRMLLCATATETSWMVSPSVNEWSCFETSGMMTTVERPHSDLLLQVVSSTNLLYDNRLGIYFSKDLNQHKVGFAAAYIREEHREVKHRGVRFRERREGCRGPRGRSWSSGSRHREPSSGRGVQPGKSARAAETGGDQKKERHGKKERKRSNTQAGMKKADTEERPQEPADKQRAGLGWERGPRKGRGVRRLEANGRAGRGEGGALGETTPMGGRAGAARSQWEGELGAGAGSQANGRVIPRGRGARRRESQWEAEPRTAGGGPPREGRETRKAVGAGSGADNLSNPLWDELGHALRGPGTPARQARPRLLPLPARGGGGGAGLGTPASAAGRRPRAASRAVLPRPYTPGLLAAGGAVVLRPWARSLPGHWETPRGVAGKTSGLPRAPGRLCVAPSRARPWTRPREPGLAEAAGAGVALLGAEGPAVGGGIPVRGVSRRKEPGGAAGGEPGGTWRRHPPAAPTRAAVACFPREPGRARGEALAQLGLPGSRSSGATVLCPWSRGEGAARSGLPGGSSCTFFLSGTDRGVLFPGKGK